MSAELKEQVKNLVGSVPADLWTVKQVIRKIVENKGEVSSDDVRFYVKEFRPSKMIIGAAFRELVQNGFLIKRGSKRTDVASSKGRDIAIYVLAQ